MRVYIFKRLVIAGVTLLGMSMLIFVLMRLAPGNITDMIFESAGYVDEADRRKLEAELGIDKPVVVQYGRWLARVPQRRSRQVVPLRSARLGGHQAAAARDPRARRPCAGVLGGCSACPPA